MNSTAELTRPQYTFGQYSFDPRSGELYDGQKTAQLRPQVAKLLELLLSHANDTVSRDEIRHHLWGDHVVVEFEEGISACVRQLRIALNDGADGTRYIQTISRRGYKFVYAVALREGGSGGFEKHPSSTAPPPVPVLQVVPTPAPPAWRHRAAVSSAVFLVFVLALATVGFLKRSGWSWLASPESSPASAIAILPFGNLSQNPNNAILGASVANEVTNLLGPISPGRLRVIANTSAAHFVKGNETIGDIGRELGASYVLEGSITELARRLHISVRLIRVADQSYVWGDEYDLDSNYSGGNYQQLVIKIATQVATRLAPDAAASPLEFTPNRDAAIAYQRGRSLIAQGDTEKAYGYCEKAMGLDPRFAAAYSCAVRAVLRAASPSMAQVTAANGLIDKALALDSGSAEAHLLKGELGMFYVWNLPAAGAEFKESLRLNPGDAWSWQMYAEYLSAMGMDNEMQNAMDTARALDPVSVSVTNNLALVSFVARQYDKAEANARTNAGLNAQDALAQHILTLSLLGGGKYAAAVKQAGVEMQALGASPKDIAVLNGSHASLVEYFKWYSAHLASRPADKLTAVFLADAYMHLGQPDQAAAVLNGAIQRKEISTLIPFISVWPSLRPLCTVPSYLALTRQLGQVGCLPQ